MVAFLMKKFPFWSVHQHFYLQHSLFERKSSHTDCKSSHFKWKTLYQLERCCYITLQWPISWSMATWSSLRILLWLTWQIPTSLHITYNLHVQPTMRWGEYHLVLLPQESCVVSLSGSYPRLLAGLCSMQNFFP